MIEEPPEEAYVESNNLEACVKHMFSLLLRNEWVPILVAVGVGVRWRCVGIG